MRTLALLAVLSTAASAQSNRAACSLAPGIEKEYQALPSMLDLSLSWDERYGPRRELAKRYPSDWPLQFLLQQPLLHNFAMGREWDAALAHYQALPDPLLGELLEASLISSLHRKKSREAIDHVLTQAANSPWTHLARLEWAADRMNGDPALAAQEFEEFRQRCPDSLLAFQFLGSVRDPQKLRGHVLALRSAIETEKKRGLDESELELFRTAWTWERVTYGDNHVQEFRRAVRTDLNYLRDHLKYDSWHWVFMVSYGYNEVLKESAAVRAIEDEALLRAPNGQAAWWIAQERWKEQNPAPPQSAPEPNEPFPQDEVAAGEEYGARYNAFMLSLMERFYGKPYAARDASRLLNAQTLPPGTFERLADFVLSDMERFPDQSTSWPPEQMQIAEAYVEHKIRLDRVPALVQQGVEQVAIQEKYRRDSDAFLRMPRPKAGEDNITMTERRAREILIRHAIVSGQEERAIALLSDFRRELDQSKPADTRGSAANLWRSNEMTYSMLARQAGLDVPMPDISVSKPEEPERYPVADFEAKDLSGKTWSRADLQGKVTYLLFWRTGCGGSCLNGVQQLYQHWQNRADRAVLSISLDENPAIAKSFMKENEFSFPVICGADIAEKFNPIAGWPMAFFIDPQARRVQRHAPRGQVTLAQIEDLADKIAATQ